MRRVVSMCVLILLAACSGSEQKATMKPKKGGASATPPAAPESAPNGECLGKPSDVASYMDKLKNANVMQTDITVPPAEAKGGAQLTFDPKRRILVCDAAGCLAKNGDGGGVSSKATYGSAFAKGLAKAVGKCGKIYVVAPDVLPRAKVDQVLKGLAGAKCSVHAIVRQSIQGLPRLEANPELGASLKSLSETKFGPARQLSAKALVKKASAKVGKSCGKLSEMVVSLDKAKGYARYDVAMKQLKGNALASCFCAMPPDDAKLLAQVGTFNALAFEMFFYKARAVPAGSLKKKGKTWYELVSAL